MLPSRLPALGLALSLLAVGPLAGCASVPRAAPSLDVEAKSFTPSAGKARLYVVRPSSMVGAAVALHVVVDGRELGSTSRGTYLMTEVEPGEHTIGAKTMENADQEKLAAEAGRSYFFVIRPKMGFFSARVGLTAVSDEDGRKEVEKASRAESAF